MQLNCSFLASSDPVSLSSRLNFRPWAYLHFHRFCIPRFHGLLTQYWRLFSIFVAYSTGSGYLLLLG